jgi:hypothetical protein
MRTRFQYSSQDRLRFRQDAHISCHLHTESGTWLTIRGLAKVGQPPTNLLISPNHHPPTRVTRFADNQTFQSLELAIHYVREISEGAYSAGQVNMPLGKDFVQKTRKAPNLALVQCDNSLCTGRNDTRYADIRSDEESQP